MWASYVIIHGVFSTYGILFGNIKHPNCGSVLS